MKRKEQSKTGMGMLIGIMLLLIISLVVGACAKAPAPATPTPAKPVATPTPAPAPVQVVKLRWAGLSNPKTGVNANTLLQVWWLEEMQKRAGGKLQIEEFWGGALGTAREMDVLLAKGSADLGQVLPAYVETVAPWDIPMSQIFFLVSTFPDAIRVTRTLYNEFPVFPNQWEAMNLKWLLPEAGGPYGLLSKKPWTTLADLKGKKLYSNGTYMPKIYAAVGAVPVSINAEEVYDGLSKGVIDGRMHPVDSTVAQKLYEVTKYWVDAGIGATYGVPILMNLDAYKRLPDDVRKVIDEVSRQADAKVTEIVLSRQAEDRAFLEKQGMTFLRFSDEDIKKWRADTGDLMNDMWVKDMEKKGGQGVLAKKIAARITELTK